MLAAQGRHQLLVHRLVAVLCEDPEQGLSLVQSLGGLVKSASKAVRDEGGLEDFLDSRVDVHGAPSGGGSGRGNVISFNIRHFKSFKVLYSSSYSL